MVPMKKIVRLKIKMDPIPCKLYIELFTKISFVEKRNNLLRNLASESFKVILLKVDVRISMKNTVAKR